MRGQAEHAGMAVALIGIGLEMIGEVEQCCRLRQHQQQRENGGSQVPHWLWVGAAATAQGVGFFSDLARSRSSSDAVVLIAIPHLIWSNAPAPARCAHLSDESAAESVPFP